MIRRLRAKFIALSMGSLLMVLAIILGSVNLINYREIVQDADAILDILAQNGGRFPKAEGKTGKPRKLLSPETPYESRYFSVALSDGGQVVTVDTGKIRAVDTSTAIAYAQQVWPGQAQGFLNDYRYVKAAQEDGWLIVFLDCAKSLSTFRSFLLTSCAISLAGILAVLMLVVLLSGRIMKPVAQSYEKQKQFITNAGHELKTPLTIIDADAEILLMELGENPWLEDIQLQTKRLAALTGDLITLSRMEESERLQMIDFPFSDMVLEMVGSFQGLAKSQGKEVVSRIQPMLTLRADEKALRQLLSILLDNALKYSPAGSAIAITLDRQGHSLRLTVENTAPAIPREELPLLFDRFYRGEPSRNSQTGGYGIGLSIAKAIVAAHKGRIFAAQQGQTLKMTVTLPA